MYWIKEMQNAIGFIEDRLTEELSMEDIARSANSSAANFQRIFSIVTGMTVGEYIRSRRLTLAGRELADAGAKALDVAVKYGYETAESINETPFETQSRVLSAIGWDARYITVQRGRDGSFMNTDAARIRQDFVAAIDRGFPVLMRYIEHPDCDLNLFFGYEDDGRKIIGYDYNKGFEPGVSLPSDISVPVTWEDWEQNIAGYILLKGRAEAASERSAALATFRMISEHARSTAEIRGRKIGLAAWEAFLRDLARDDFAGLSAEEVKNRFFIYCDALCQIYARKAALPYYTALAERFPEWREPLGTAVQALDACAAYGGFLWGQGFTFDDAGFEKFRSLEARRVLADAGREAMRRDELAVEQFEGLVG